MMRFGILALLAGATCLASCGNSRTGQEFRSALAAAGELATPEETPSPELLGRASFQAVPGPLLFVVLRNGSAAAPMVPFGDNRGHRTWSTAEKQTLTLRQGMLVATRGLGDDLMASDATGSARAVSAGSGSGVARVMWHLDGEDRIAETRFVCRVEDDGRERITLLSGERLETKRVSETCANQALGFTNTYWKADGGTVRRSRQWVSPDVGHATLEVLRE